MKQTSSFLFSIILCVFANGPGFGETIKDALEVRVDIRPVFELTLETRMIPLETPFQEKDLLKPSLNQIEAGQDLGGEINLGYLIARKGSDGYVFPLISEYKVLMRVYCQTNHSQSYQVSQMLLSPITGSQHGEVLPNALVSKALIDETVGRDIGEVLLREATPVLPGIEEVIYRSGETQQGYLGNVIDVLFWISDSQDERIEVTQRSDVYSGTLVVTLLEL